MSQNIFATYKIRMDQVKQGCTLKRANDYSPLLLTRQFHPEIKLVLTKNR